MIGRLIRILGRGFMLAALLIIIIVASSPIVPGYFQAMDDVIIRSAARHGVPPYWLAAILYNEMFGTEDRLLRQLLPGEDAIPRTMRQGLLGLDFLLLKPIHWGGEALLALAGGDPTIGPTGIRVSVGREIWSERPVTGGRYQPIGWAERPSMILDLLDHTTAVEYLAANLRRAQERLRWEDRGDWTVSARWHNTGVIYDSEIVRREDWQKGSLYVERVKGYLPQVTAWLGLSTDDYMDAAMASPKERWRAVIRRPALSIIP